MLGFVVRLVVLTAVVTLVWLDIVYERRHVSGENTARRAVTSPRHRR